MNKSFLLLSLVLSLQACHSASNADSEKPLVSVSILPQKYFLERLAGELVEVHVMIPPGASPASYEPTISQLEKLDQSELYLQIGYIGFELGWMEKIKSVNREMAVADLSEGVMLIHGETQGDHNHGHDHGGTDPHIWLSARNAKTIAANMHRALSTLLPGQQDLLSSNLQGFLEELDSLDRAISGLLSGLEHKSFMIYHPALSYFARDYGLEQLPLELEGKTPSPAHMRSMADRGKAEHITSIFLQKQFDQKNARVLAKEIGASVVVFDPLDLDWHRQMLFIAEKMKASF